MEELEQMDKQVRDLIEIIRFTESVSAKIHGLLDEAEICRTVREEFAKSRRYAASILLLTDDGSKLRIAETSLPPEELKAGEKATWLRLKEYRIDLNRSSVFSRKRGKKVVREGKTVQCKVSDVIAELFPRPLAHLISKTIGYEKMPSILTPLKRRGKIIGALAVSSTDLAEHFIPSVRNLAQHISTALELAEEHAKLKRAEEELRASHTRLETSFDAIANSLYTVDQGSLIPTLIDQIKKLAKIETYMSGAEETQRIDAELRLHTEHLKELVEERISELLKAERIAAIGEAAAMIAHDLRNPLQDIRLARYLLGKHCPHEQKLLNQIDRCVAYADGIVENLLIYSRERPLVFQETDVNQLLGKSIRESALPKYITIEEKLSELPGVYVDPAQMKRVFQNLILNAAQAMEDGGTLTVESRHGGGSLVISFQDTGVGISETKLALIWRPFYTTKSRGMGLGLSIAKQIVERHGGTINVKSRLGEGSTFTIQIPLQARSETTSDLIMGQEFSQKTNQ